MGNLALILKELGWAVQGSDGPLYPPMSELLSAANIEVMPYSASVAQQAVDCYVVGNSVSRGNPLLEAILNAGLPYTSGPAFLAEHVLQGRDVMAVAGTHGKTTTSCMLVHMLQRLGHDPGYLVGARLGSGTAGGHIGGSPLFVIEADEYDSAFSDKRAKFVHYKPKWAIMNNIELDHVDIYPNLAAIETQFHHLVRLIPSNGALIYPHNDQAIARVLARGCWTKHIQLGQDWIVQTQADDRWQVVHAGYAAKLGPQIVGKHNAHNAMAALAALDSMGLDWQAAAASLDDFSNAARRMQDLGEHKGIRLYTDFAHHPTAIQATVSAMRSLLNGGALHVVLHPASNSMRTDLHKHTLPQSLAQVNGLWLYQPNPQAYNWHAALATHPGWHGSYTQAEPLVASLNQHCRAGDIVLSLSNGNIEQVHRLLLN